MPHYPPPPPWVGPGGDLMFLVNQMPHVKMPLSQGGWVHGDLTFTPQIFYFYMKYDYVEKSVSASNAVQIWGGGGGGGGGGSGHAIDKCIM